MTRIGESVDEPTTTGSRHLRDAVDKVLPKVLDDLRRMISVPGVSFPEFDPVPVEQSAVRGCEFARLAQASCLKPCDQECILT